MKESASIGLSLINSNNSLLLETFLHKSIMLAQRELREHQVSQAEKVLNLSGSFYKEVGSKNCIFEFEVKLTKGHIHFHQEVLDKAINRYNEAKIMAVNNKQLSNKVPIVLVSMAKVFIKHSNTIEKAIKFSQKAIKYAENLINLNDYDSKTVESLYEATLILIKIESEIKENPKETHKWVTYADDIKSLFSINAEIENNLLNELKVINRFQNDASVLPIIRRQSSGLTKSPIENELRDLSQINPIVGPTNQNFSMTVKETLKNSLFPRIPNIDPLGADFVKSKIDLKADFYHVEKQTENIIRRKHKESNTPRIGSPNNGSNSAMTSQKAIKIGHKRNGSDVVTCSDLENYLKTRLEGFNYLTTASKDHDYIRDHLEIEIKQGSVIQGPVLPPIRITDFSELSRKSTNSTTDLKIPSKYSDMSGAALAIQSYARRYKYFKKYKYHMQRKKLYNEYLAFGKKDIKGIQYFITITKESWHQKMQKDLMARASETNVILEAVPLESKKPIPKYHCYTVGEILRILKISGMDELDQDKQKALLEKIYINSEGVLQISRVIEIDPPVKRLVFRAKSYLNTNNLHHIRIYEHTQGEKEQILITAQSKTDKTEVLVAMA